jgi:uncharacterized protein YkwD
MRSYATALGFVLGGVLVPLAEAETPAEAAYAQRLSELVNQYRQRKGLHALSFERDLGKLAYEHSVAMGAAKRLSHDQFPSRVHRSGRAMCVENVGWNYKTAEGQFDAWRASPGHDGNLLDKRVDRMGIGVAKDYVTLMACN